MPSVRAAQAQGMAETSLRMVEPADGLWGKVAEWLPLTIVGIIDGWPIRRRLRRPH